MAVTLDPTGTADPITAEYYTLEQDGSPAIYLHRDVAAGIVRDIRDGNAASGLLLGTDHGKSVWIDRYRRDGGTALPGEDSGALSVAGFYRTRPAAPGAEREPGGLLLIVDSVMGEAQGRFYRTNPEGQSEPVSPAFTIRSSEPERPRRLVPDFEPRLEPRRPDRQFFLDYPPVPAVDPSTQPEEHNPPAASGRFASLRKWWPLLAAIVLSAGAVRFMPHLRTRPVLSAHSAAPGATLETERPLGLSTDTSGQTWRVSWNPAATALRDARNVRLFVREGDDQNRIELSSADLRSATYQYTPAGRDVTFRLEVTDRAGRVSAESFRVVKAAPSAPNPVPPAAKSVPPQPIHKVAPVVPAGIRPRIRRKVTVDVRVEVDAQGHVASAAAIGRHRAGIETYLANAAVRAARQWQFEPARRNGTAAAGSETIHFEFEK